MAFEAEFCHFGERCSGCEVAGLADTTRANMGVVVDAAKEGWPIADLLPLAAEMVKTATPGGGDGFRNPDVQQSMVEASQRIAGGFCDIQVEQTVRKEELAEGATIDAMQPSFFQRILSRIGVTNGKDF